MVKRLWGFALIMLVIPLCFIGSAQKGSAVDTEVIYYNALTNTVKISYFSPYQTIYGTKGVDTILGSGVILGGNQVLTCYHVLDKFPAGVIKIFQVGSAGIAERTGEQVKVLAFNEKYDLLLLGVEPPFDTPCVEIALSEPPIGSEIIITGHTSLPLTRLRLGRYLENRLGIMVTPVYMGDSGGGVFDASGKLIGIIRMCLMLDKESTLYGYATPLTTIQEFLNERPR